MPTLSNPVNLLRKVSKKIGRKNKILAAIVGASFIFTGTLMATAPKHDPAEIEEKSWPVSSITARSETLSPELQLFGRVETPNHATLSAAVETQVTVLAVQEGQAVKAGELLVALDPAEERLHLQQREADLSDARSLLQSAHRDITTDREVLAHMEDLHALTRSKAQRLKTLNSKQLIATEQLENTLQEVARQSIELSRQQALVDNHSNRLASAEAAVERASAALENQRLNLARTDVRAPFDGRVSKMLVSPGDRVRPGQELVSVYDTSAMQVRVPIPTDAIMQLKSALRMGTDIRATLTDSGLVAELSQLAGAVSQGRTGADAIFTVADPHNFLELGRAVDVKIRLPKIDSVIALPLYSIYSNRRVYVIEDERLRSVAIAPLGQRINSEGEIEVLIDESQLAAGTTVLATNLPKATSGLKVQVINDNRALASVANGAG
ncbi:MAG: efflux RND transporter periplasmic adaptor subunit [Halioglobus sp.]